MFERTCYQKLDEPVLVWAGLEFGEIVTALAVGAGTSILGGFVLDLGFFGLFGGFGTGAALVLLFRKLRSGGPGYVFAQLYRTGFVEVLPPGIRPRHLLPLFGAARTGRIRLGPVFDPENRHGRRVWFGK